MTIFNFKSNIAVLKGWISSQPKNGYGVAQSLAQRLRISSVLFSQILSGQRTLQLEKAIELTEAMSLDSNEKEYFLLLTELQNAGTEKLKKYFEQKIISLRSKTLDIKENVRNESRLDEHAKAVFYSNWIYSAVRLATDIDDLKTPQKISERLRIPIEEVVSALDFLILHGLCRKENNKYAMAVQNTHLDSDSPWIYSRQLQWRVKSQQSMLLKNTKNLFYTGPMVLSLNDVQLIHEKLVKMIKEATEIVRESKSEELFCLNIDWFKIEG